HLCATRSNFAVVPISSTGALLVVAAIKSIGRSDAQRPVFWRLQQPGDDSRFRFGTLIADGAARVKVPTLYPRDHRASAKIWMHERQGGERQDVFLSFDQGFQDAAH